MDFVLYSTLVRPCTAYYVISVRRFGSLPAKVPHLDIRLPSDSTSRWTPLPSANASYCRARSGLSAPSCYPCRAHYNKKRQPKWLSLLCWRYLFFRPVSRQVSSAQVSLTSVFGMGTGGPSLQSTPTYFFLKEKASKKNFTPFFFQEEGLRFNYHTLKTEQSNRHTLRKRLHSISSSQPETSGQALGLLVPVSSIHYCTSTSGLSTI